MAEELAKKWLVQTLFPQIQSMLLADAYFKLASHANELTGCFSGPIGGLIISGHVTTQTLAIRRLNDDRRDVISLRRLVRDLRSRQLITEDEAIESLAKLGQCDYICDLVNDYVAHIPNPDRKPNLQDWKLDAGHLTEAHRAICEVALTLDRRFADRILVRLVPVPQIRIMDEFNVPKETVPELWEFWHNHTASVDNWINGI